MKTLLCVFCVLCGFSLPAAPFTNATYRVTAEWDRLADPSESGYVLYCSTNSFWVGTNQVLAPALVARMDAGTNVTADVTNLLPGVRYFFVVTSTTTNGIESDYSNQVDVMVVKPPAPQAPRVMIRLSLERAPTLEGPWAFAADLTDLALCDPDNRSTFWRLQAQVPVPH